MKVRIDYNYAASKDNGHRECEAYLEWTDSSGNKQMVWAKARSWDEARKKVIEKFKRVPPSEELEIEK